MPPRGRKHWCKHCKKSFPSGNSLGGHMALHRNRRKKQRSGTPSTVGERYGLRERCQKTWCLPDSTSSDDDPWALFPKTECQLCFKSFTSRDALSIHMRVHMGRRNKMVVDHNVSVSDHNLAVFAVPVRKKRSRRIAPDTFPAPMMMASGIEEVDAAHILVMLSGDHGMCSTFLGFDQDCEIDVNAVCDAPMEEIELSSSDHHGLIRGDDEIEIELSSSDHHGMIRGDDEIEIELSSSDHHGLIRGDDELMELETSTSSYEGLKFASLSEVFKATTSYDCKLCGKVFTSARSLGGHKKGHKAIRKSAATQPCKQLLELDRKPLVLSLPAPDIWNYRRSRSKSEPNPLWGESSLQGEGMLGIV
uniref:Uncharacterized protein n=1 Tax=Avena sativa TaxID=4498 RepID=A0ACD5W7Q3_AVESA